MPPQIGEALGRYHLEEQVGQGGMAVVYRAVDSVLGRTVAVKVIRPAFTEDPHFLERFLQEARLVASLDHPNVLPLYDFGEENGAPYLVLPYLPGGSLSDRMNSVPQPLATVAAWLIQLAGALDAAHARGVLHRDVKPGNVLVTKDGRLVLGDFGIARLAEATTRLTATGMVVGTPLYMAPELARGGDGSPASDRYALAVMTYEMIAGSPPFKGSNPLSVLHQQVHEPVPALASRLPELPAGLDAFLRRALAKSPTARQPSARAMAEELVQLLSPDQRAELSTLVWAGSPEAMASSNPEAPTVVTKGQTLRLSGPGGRPAPSSRTGAVTAVVPRSRRGWPLMWGLLAVVAVAGMLLLVPHDLLTGGKGRGGAPVASALPAGQPASGAEGGVAAGQPGGGLAPAGAAASSPRQAETVGAGKSAEPSTAPAEAGATTASGAGDDEAASSSLATSPMNERAAPPALGPGFLPGRDARREVFDLLRRPTHRMSAADFHQLIAATGNAENDRTGMRERLLAMRDWAFGGLAYAQGRLDEANQRRTLLGNPNAPWGVGWPALVFNQGSKWELAAIYADPKKQLDTLLQPELPGLGANPRAALAAAYSAHLDDDHRAALRLLADAGVDPSREVAGTQGRAVVAQFLTAEAMETGDGEAARRWMPIALDGGRAPLARPFLVEMVGLARETLGSAAAQEVRDQACRLGIKQLCAGGMDVPAQRPLLERLGRRRRPGGGPGSE